MTQEHPITPPPPHLLKKFSTEARNESNKRNGAGYLKTFATLCIEWAISNPTSSLSQIRSSEIQLPTELVMEWVNNHYGGKVHRDLGGVELSIAAQAAQWGADEELAALLVWLRVKGFDNIASDLLAARRPEPPSLKEQALKMLRPLSNPVMPGTPEYRLYEPQAEIIRRALEAIDD
jgi:hypothetical protein